MMFKLSKETKKQLDELMQQQEIASRVGEMSRARSVTVGTSFGGTTEISMRASDGKHIWCILQPVEAIELIHQLAANIGCHINIKPREDFSSWRGWRNLEDESLKLNGHPPFAGELPSADNLGAKLPPPEEQPGMSINRSKENVVATKKTVNGRSAKRTSKTT